MSDPGPDHCDILIAGGGLAGGLIALALAKKSPELDLRIVDPSPQLGGNHIWSFFGSDVADENRWLVEPLICHSWPGYDVAFPAHRRTMDAAYFSIESERLDAVVRAAVTRSAVIAASVIDAVPQIAAGFRRWRVTLDDGRVFSARHFIDARGGGDLSVLECGWQKFVGLAVTVPGGHGLTRPIVMDATVPQIDGYRFVYCLPFDAETVFLEDTYYSDTPNLDVPTIRERIVAYAAARGWKTNGGGREETGVLPVVIGGDFQAYWNASGADTAKAGARAGLFHATTGYSLPEAVRLAAAMPGIIERNPYGIEAALRRHARRHWQGQAFYRLLDTMLFRAAAPMMRYKVLERFYTLSPALVGRFYAGQSTVFDKLRILSGKPPVPIAAAIKAIMGRNR